MLQWQWRDLGATERTRKLYVLESTFWFGCHCGEISMFPQAPIAGECFEVSVASSILFSRDGGVPHRAQLLLAAATKNPTACVVSSSQMMFVSSGKCTRFPSQSRESFHGVPVLL